MTFNDGTTPPKDNRMLAVVLCAVAGLLLAYSAFSHRWLENRRSKQMTIGMSLRSTELCNHTDWEMDDVPTQGCVVQSNSAFIDWVKGQSSRVEASGAWAPIGIVTMVLLLLAAASLLGCAGLGVAQKRVAWPMLPTTPALLGLMASLITGCVFIATKPGGVGGVGVGIGFWAFGVGAVVGIAGAQMIAKLIKPIDPDILTEPF